MDVVVTGGTISEAVIEAYKEYVKRHYPYQTVSLLEIEVDGEHVSLRTHLQPQRFERIRRITGYLVGDMSRWNNAKRAEEGDRVKHQ